MNTSPPPNAWPTTAVSIVSLLEGIAGADDDTRYDVDAGTGTTAETMPAELQPGDLADLNYFYAALELTVALLAIIGNAAVITVFCRERRLRKRTNYYIVSLAMADFLVGLLGIPFAILASVGLPRNLYGCLLTLSALVVLCTISIFCLVAVSIDRYWAILYPLAYSRNVRTKTAIGIISFCWAFGIFIGFLPLLGWRAASAGPKQACLFVQVMDYDYLVFLYFATIILPALMLLLFYAHIYTVIMKQVRKTVHINPLTAAASGPGTHKPTLMSMSRSQGGTMLRVLGAARKREVKATQNLSVIVLFFMICWLPLYTINCIKAFCPDCHIPAWLTLFLIILSHLNSAMNPLLYAYHLKDFRAALKTLICRVFGLKVQQEEINYRFSVHSQNRMASRMEKRVSSALHPKIYIDSPVYHRQQAGRTPTSPITAVPSPLISRHLHSPGTISDNSSSDMRMWRILEVSVDDRSGSSGPPATATESPFDRHEYIFNYDPLDSMDTTTTRAQPAAAAATLAASAVFDVASTMARLGREGTIDEYRSLPVFYDNAAVDTSAEGPTSRRPSTARTSSNVRRRSVTFSDLVQRPRPSYQWPLPQATGVVIDTGVLRLETSQLLEHEREAEASDRAALTAGAVRTCRWRRRRRCRSTSFDVRADGDDVGSASVAASAHHQRKLSRSWTALHCELNGKHSFS